MMTKVGRLRGLLFGGDANNGANAGFVYANSEYVPSASIANIGSHLCFENSTMETAALPLGRKHKFRKELVGMPFV